LRRNQYEEAFVELKRARRAARYRFAAAVAAGLASVALPKDSLGVAWNGTEPSYSAVNANGLTDNYGQFTNESVITDYTDDDFGTCTYLGNGWFLTAQHVIENDGVYGTEAPGGSIAINVYGTTYNVDQYSGFGSADVMMVHVAGFTSNTITNLTGVESRQIPNTSDNGYGLVQVGGFGLNGELGSTTVNNQTFHRGFNTPYSVSAPFLYLDTAANSRLVNDGYMMGVIQPGDSGSGLWQDNATDQDLDLADWNLLGVTQTGGSALFDEYGFGFGYLPDYSGQIQSVVYPHASLTWNSSTTTTATDGGGTWNLSATSFTDGTGNYAFLAASNTSYSSAGTFTVNQDRTEVVTFGAGNGAAGTVTLGATIPIDELVFNAAGSGNYTIAGSGSYSLQMDQASASIANVNATISANITGGNSGQYGEEGEVRKFGTGNLTLTGATTLNSGVAFEDRAGTVTLASTGSLAPGYYTSVALYNGDAAALTVQDNATFNGAGQDLNLGDLGGTGTLNVLGNGSLSVGQLYVGKGWTQTVSNGTQPASGAGYGIVNQTGGTIAASNFVQLGYQNSGSAGTYNLSGGTLLTSEIGQGLGQGTINFNGGTLEAASATYASTFLQGLTSATVAAGGVTINTNGYGITVGQPLTHTGSAVDGGLTKLGSGMLTLTGSSGYTGPTLVTAGTLALGSGGSIGGSSGVTINGSGAKFLQLSSVPLTPAVTVTTGTLDGVGTVGVVQVGSGTGGIVTDGNGSAGVLTMSSLTFTGAGTDTARIAGGSSLSTPGQVVTGALTVPSATGAVTVNVAGQSFNSGSTYDLVQFGSLNGGTLSSFALGTNGIGLGHNQSSTLGISGSYLTLAVGGYVDQYTGALNTTWSTATTASPHNFQESTNTSVKVDYVDTDAVLFDDTPGAGTHIINLGSAVSPAWMTFNNSTGSYTISSTGGFGIGGTGGIIKNGTGTVAISTINSFTGPVVVNAGTLFAEAPNAANSGALAGTSGVTVNSGATLLTSENGLFGYNLANEQPITLNAGGTLNASASTATTHLGQLTLAGGTLAYPGTPSGDGATYGTYNLDKGVVAGGTSTTSVISALGVNPTESGGTVFNVAAGTTSSGIDLNVTGTLVDTALGDTGIIKTGMGMMVLSSSNNYTGGTTVDGGTLSISNDSNMGSSGSAMSLNGATLRTTNTTALVNSHPITVGSSGGTLSIIGNGTTTTGQADRFVLGTANTLLGSGNLTISGDGSLAGTAPNTTTAGAGAFVIDASNTYSGNVTLQNGGLIEYAAATALGTGTVNLGNEAEFSVTNGVTATSAVNVNGGTNSVISFTNSAGTLSGSVALNANATIGLRNWYNYAGVQSGTIAGAISGSGGLTVNSGTGSGGVLTLGGANTFIGNLTINSSTVDADYDINANGPTYGALGNATASGRTVTINNGSSLVMTVGNVLGTGAQTTAPALSFIVNQGGVLETAAADVSAGGGGDANIFGNITLNGGTLTAGNGATAQYQSVILLGTITTGGTAASTINTIGTNTLANGVQLATTGTTFSVGATGSGGTDLTVSAPLVDAPGGAGSLIKSGLGTMLLTATNTYTGATTVAGGQVKLTGQITATSTMAVGSTSGAGAAFYQSGSSSVLTNTGTGGGGFQIGGTAGAFGYYNISGGTINVGGEIDPGGSAGGSLTFGQLDMNGGTLNLPNITGTYFLPDRGAAGEFSVTNFLGGTVQIAGSGAPTNSGFNGLAVGLNNVGSLTSTITIANSAQFLTPSLTVKLNDTSFGGAGNATNVSNLNLNGGTLQTLGFGAGVSQGSVALGNAYADINFNGGTVKAGTAANTTFLTGLGAVNIYANGGTIDNNGQAITIGQTLTSASGTGVGSVAFTAGSGYVAPPRVVFSGGALAGNGATGYATINPTTGAVTGIVVTNPGSYSSTSGLTASLVGVSGTGASAGAITLNSGNTTGTLTFQGAGTTTLSGASTYTGPTTINAGMLRLTGSTAAGSAVTVNNGGTLEGTGTFNGALTLNAGGKVWSGDSIGTLHGASMTWNSNNSTSGGFFDLSTSNNTSDTLALTGVLSKGTGSTFAFDFIGGTDGTTYTLITFSSTTFTQAPASTQFVIAAQSLSENYTGTFLVTSTAVDYTPSSVPEPSSFALLGVASAGLLKRRRRSPSASKR
jgi:fibronectin-binding autotransporter adhesin